MNPTELYMRLLQAALFPNPLSTVEEAIQEFEADPQNHASWVSFGDRENNAGIIGLSADPGRAVVERITNAVDAVLESEFELHQGSPDCRSPKEAAQAWLNVPDGGLSDLSQQERQRLANRVVVRIRDGEGRENRIVDVQDQGIGLTAEEMPNTILSLNQSNKLQKFYLAGTYGQGGSGTLVHSKYTLIASRKNDSDMIGFTVARFQDLPPDSYKEGHWVYLKSNGRVPTAELSAEEFHRGTLVRHFGYDLTAYPSPLGPNSMYGLLNQVLFDPVMPIWLDNPVNNQRRVIKGSRNALNGAVDEGDEQRRGPELAHSARMFYVPIGEFGQLGCEYWVLATPSEENKRPSASFVNDKRPILLTINGQNHSELSVSLIRRDAGLPYLATRLICHVNCDHLTPRSKRALFVSTREEARRGAVLNLIEQELVRILKSDDELTRLNEEARLQGLHESDQDAIREMRREVARLLRLQGQNVLEAVGGDANQIGDNTHAPTHPPRPPRPPPRPIELHDPPTYIRIVNEEPITFHPEQRRYIRIETDAPSQYHDPNNQNESRINIISNHGNITKHGSTPLQGGRLRAIFDCSNSAQVGTNGTIRVELSRSGLPVLFDEKRAEIIATPLARPDARQIALPEFDVRPVDYQDTNWLAFEWPDDITAVASSSVEENDRLVVYFSTVFPAYRNQLTTFEARDQGMVTSFTERYKIWLAVHAFLIQRDQQAQQQTGQTRTDDESTEVRERQERCRMATMAAFFATNEVRSPEIVRAQQES